VLGATLTAGSQAAFPHSLGPWREAILFMPHDVVAGPATPLTRVTKPHAERARQAAVRPALLGRHRTAPAQVHQVSWPPVCMRFVGKRYATTPSSIAPPQMDGCPHAGRSRLLSCLLNIASPQVDVMNSYSCMRYLEQLIGSVLRVAARQRTRSLCAPGHTWCMHGTCLRGRGQ
jgi:hypothetical protein